MKAEPLAFAPVSVVIPAYNSAGTIGRSLASVQVQTVKPKEIIVVDDASTDDTVQLLEAEAARYPTGWIRILRQKRNQGPASARNKGWDAATGRYISFLDADDTWHPRKLERQYAWMEAHPEAALTAHRCAVFERSLALNEIPDPRVRRISPILLLCSNVIATSSVMLRRELPQRFATDKRYAEDYLLWLQLALSGKDTYLIDAPLAFRYKAVYGAKGLSKRLWRMERGVLGAYRQLHKDGMISFVVYALLVPYSLLKFLRRAIVSKFGAA